MNQNNTRPPRPLSQAEELYSSFIMPDAEPDGEEVFLTDEVVDFILPEEDYDEENGFFSVDESAEGATDADREDEGSRRNPLQVLWEGFRINLPARGDEPGVLIRKCTFLAALVVLIGSLAYILADVCFVPLMNKQLSNELQELYTPENSNPAEGGRYPEGMLASFEALYDRNPDLRGWLSYHATGKKDFLNIDYPVVFSGDHDKYLRTDFDGNKNKNGTLFLDKNTVLQSKKDVNKSLIIYGHNMASGQMFAGLNSLIGSVNNARVSAEITFSTLFEQSKYRVFAVVLTDEEAEGVWYFNTRRTKFNGTQDFMNFVEQLRARSLFDYPIDVNGEDEILVLSTCTARSTSKLKDGRLTVIARKVRSGEMPLDTAQILRNEDVIMPLSWYTNQDLPLHAFYQQGYVPADPAVPNSTAPTGQPTVSEPTSATGDSTTGTQDATSSASTESTGENTVVTTAPTTTGQGTTAPTGSTTTASAPTSTTTPTSTSTTTPTSTTTAGTTVTTQGTTTPTSTTTASAETTTQPATEDTQTTDRSATETEPAD